MHRGLVGHESLGSTAFSTETIRVSSMRLGAVLCLFVGTTQGLRRVASPAVGGAKFGDAAAARRSVVGWVFGAAVLGPAASARALELPKVSNPLTTLVPTIPGVEIGGVEINPFKEIDVERPEVPEAAKPVSVDDLILLARKGEVKSVQFLTPAGDKAVATLADGSLASVVNPNDSTSGNLRLTAKLRDFGVPYTQSYDLSKWQQAAKRTSMRVAPRPSRRRFDYDPRALEKGPSVPRRARNQNVLDAEERGKEEAAKRAAMDERLAAAASPGATAP